jgi:hypothetical protein
VNSCKDLSFLPLIWFASKFFSRNWARITAAKVPRARALVIGFVERCNTVKGRNQRKNPLKKPCRMNWGVGRSSSQVEIGSVSKLPSSPIRRFFKSAYTRSITFQVFCRCSICRCNDPGLKKKGCKPKLLSPVGGKIQSLLQHHPYLKEPRSQFIMDSYSFQRDYTIWIISSHPLPSFFSSVLSLNP